MTDYERIYTNIKYLAYERGMTMGGLCEQAGLYRSMLTDLKYGRKKKLSDETLQRLCKVLDCNIEDILYSNAPNTNLERPKQRRNENFYARLSVELEERPVMRRLFKAAHRATDAQVKATAMLLESILNGTLGSEGDDSE